MSTSVVVDFKQYNYPTAVRQTKEPSKRRLDEAASRHEVKEKILKLDHQNVLNLLGLGEEIARSVWEINGKTLEDVYIKPSGPVSISKTEILLQISNGLLYIHSQRIVHANLTPTSIILSGNAIKIGGFEFSQITDEQGSFTVDYFRPGADCFLAPEVIAWICESEENLNNPVHGQRSPMLTNKIDIFAAGCVFFFVLTNGYHPFGTSHLTIAKNVMNSKQINKKVLEEDSFACDMIQCMLQKKPEDRVYLDTITKWLEFVKKSELESEQKIWRELWFTRYLPEPLRMTFDATKKLGNPTADKKFRGQVFAGTYQGSDIAVKRIIKSEFTEGFPLIPFDTLKQLNHENVLKLMVVRSDEDFTYLGLELCAGSLRDYYRDIYTGPVPSNEDAFKQMANGLSYIHSNGLVHGALRPTNVLISCVSPVHLKLSDFGIRRSDGTSTMSSSTGDGKFSKEFYFAPELLRKFNPERNNETTIETPDALCDVFSLGCLFYTFLTKGDHPFHQKGNSIYFINPNILSGKVVMQGINNNCAESKLISGMLQDRPLRISLENVVNLLHELHVNIKQT